MVVNYISLIKVLNYSFPVAQLQTINAKSQYFLLCCITGLGFPLSSLLFTINIEPLEIKLCSETHSNGQKHKLSVFADSLLLYNSDTLDSLRYVDIYSAALEKFQGIISILIKARSFI